jgi:hypothetical protein
MLAAHLHVRNALASVEELQLQNQGEVERSLFVKIASLFIYHPPPRIFHNYLHPIVPQVVSVSVCVLRRLVLTCGALVDNDYQGSFYRAMAEAVEGRNGQRRLQGLEELTLRFEWIMNR